jgi:hypothetical protein
MLPGSLRRVPVEAIEDAERHISRPPDGLKRGQGMIQVTHDDDDDDDDDFRSFLPCVSGHPELSGLRSQAKGGFLRLGPKNFSELLLRAF